jgi:hypothetical protein
MDDGVEVMIVEGIRGVFIPKEASPFLAVAVVVVGFRFFFFMKSASN